MSLTGDGRSSFWCDICGEERDIRDMASRRQPGGQIIEKCRDCAESRCPTCGGSISPKGFCKNCSPILSIPVGGA